VANRSRRRGGEPRASTGEAALFEEQVERRDILQPFLGVLEGAVVPYKELVEAGRLVAGALLAQGKPISVSVDATGPASGTWNG
jgi:hypothetical protein